MLDRENRGVDLLARLELVAPVDEQHRTLGKHQGDAGGSGKAGEPREPLLGRRHVFVLVAVGVRYDEAVEPAPPQLRPQSRDATGAGRPFGTVVEILETDLEHRCATPNGPNNRALSVGFPVDVSSGDWTPVHFCCSALASPP